MEVGGGGGVVVFFKEEPNKRKSISATKIKKPGNADVDLEKCSLKLSKAN